jgi:hypothetical protein
MSETPPPVSPATGSSPAEGETCHCCSQCVCRFLSWIGALILIVIGSAIFVEWMAWSNYKKYSTDDYKITIITEKGDKVEVPTMHYIKQYRNSPRVDVIQNDKKGRTSHYAPKSVQIEKK